MFSFFGYIVVAGAYYIIIMIQFIRKSIKIIIMLILLKLTNNKKISQTGLFTRVCLFNFHLI